MTAPREDPIRLAGIPVGDVVDALRSEPALAWFVAQGLWLSQPVLEIFWPQEQIAQVAEMLETAGRPAPERQPDGGDREEHTGP
ncbi:MAG: hypothetical protein ABSA10_11375 [Anaerolineales bacterium]|jgi:hypothetical protein